MQQAVKKYRVDGCDFDLSRMTHTSVGTERPKLEFMHVSETISINSSKSWVSPRGLVFVLTTNLLYLNIHRVK